MTDPALSLAALVVAVVALLGVAVLALRRPSGTRPRAATAARGSDVEQALMEQARRVELLRAEALRLSREVRGLEEQSRHAVQRVGLVRYNPFEDTGSNQSFALALLDADDSGLVLSSLHSRQATRVYAKRIQDGRAEAPLSAEEAAALEQARSR